MIETDAVVIGAGPVGLFQVFQLGLLGLRAHVIDVLPEPGGQCAALYPDKPIYDVPGVPVCTGRELTALLLQQARPFMLPPEASAGQPANLHLGQQVAALQALPAQAGEPAEAAGFEVTTDQGLRLRAQAVFVAAGAGAFVPRAWPIPGVPADEPPANLHHHLPAPGQAAPWAGQHLVVAGGGDEALQSVADLADAPAAFAPAHITLVHRRDQFQAEPALEAQVRSLIAAGRVTLAVGVAQGAGLRRDDARHAGSSSTESANAASLMPDNAAAPPRARLTHLTLLDAQGHTRELPLDHLLVRLGLSPRLGPLSTWGLQLDRKQLAVDPATFATSLPGVYAAGDINTYPGKKRLLLCGFHEATLAAHAAAARLRPDDPQHLLYTTTSPLLHRRLGLQ